MKKFIFTVILSLIFAPLYAQQEPEFIGEVLAYNTKTQKSVLLSKERVTGLKNKQLIFASFGIATQQLTINGFASDSQFDFDDKLQFIVRSINQDLDPAAYIKVIYLKQQYYKDRRIFSSSLSTAYNIGPYTNETTSESTTLVPFTAKRFGNNSYLVEIPKPIAGEYAIVTANPHNLNEISTIFATFGLFKNYNSYNEVVANQNNPEYIKKLMDDSIEYLIEHKQSPERSEGALVFDIISKSYIQYSKFISLYGGGAHTYLTSKYPKAYKQAKAERKAQKKSATN